VVGSARNGQGDVSAVPRDHMSLLRVDTWAVSRALAPCAPDTVFRVETDRGVPPIDESGGKTVSGATPGVPKFEPRGGSTHSAFAPHTRIERRRHMTSIMFEHTRAGDRAAQRNCSGCAPRTPHDISGEILATRRCTCRADAVPGRARTWHWHDMT
jgi:hypothetical protein